MMNKNNFGTIIEKGLNNPIVKQHCMQLKDKSNEEIKKSQEEFSRFIGYCILFKDIKDIEIYMEINNKQRQMLFLINKIIKILNIKESKLKEYSNEIINFAFNNFKKNGYVFHAGNSLSISINMKNGLLNNNIDLQQQRELMQIESIYRKYNQRSQYSPIGHGASDIISEKTGWFFDGSPVHATTYANSPQWFEYLCGKSYIYFDRFSENQRRGYANRDYVTSLNAVTWLVEENKMSKEDKK